MLERSKLGDGSRESGVGSRESGDGGDGENKNILFPVPEFPIPFFTKNKQ
ncbi:hypothetical protein PN462_07465 [Spirulina sp. CS-785/01]|nr:hypothetical protein [Spirulina sp. CS-785/01]MDB9312934.1 hypothetical protein [Spirulina sp. CS-785/01]